MDRRSAGRIGKGAGNVQMKYHNRKVVTEDGVFDSFRELNRWQELKLLQRAGEIYDLQRQVPFVVIPVQKEGKKVIEREVKYIADFTYRNVKDGRIVVEDVKSHVTTTKEYVIKRKLMLYRHGIRIVEV